MDPSRRAESSSCRLIVGLEGAAPFGTVPRGDVAAVDGVAVGAGLNLAMWDGLARRIGDSYHLVALDFLDHGQSRAAGPW